MDHGPDWIHVVQDETHSASRARTVFNDCRHGSEMQRNAILAHAHEVVMREGRWPGEFADNTPKETKHQIALGL